MPAPSEFIIPTVGESTGNNGVLKAVSGAVGTQAVKFLIEGIYDGEASKATNMEVRKPMEFVEFKNDPFSSYKCRVSDMTQEQRIRTGALYEQFKTNKDSTDTPLDAWDMINENERIALLNNNIFTVEQITHFKDHEVYRLGIDGKNLRDRAVRHVNGKEAAKQSNLNDEMRAILEENKKLKLEMEEAKELYYKMQEELSSKAPKKPSTRHNVEIKSEA